MQPEWSQALLAHLLEMLGQPDGICALAEAIIGDRLANRGQPSVRLADPGRQRSIGTFAASSMAAEKIRRRTAWRD
jgi:hypothetical protein